MFLNNSLFEITYIFLTELFNFFSNFLKIISEFTLFGSPPTNIIFFYSSLYSINLEFLNFDKKLLEYNLNNSFFCSINSFFKFSISFELVLIIFLSINLKKIILSFYLIGLVTSPTSSFSIFLTNLLIET